MQNKKNLPLNGTLEFSKIFNSWRGIARTQRTKKFGISREWESFDNFLNDIGSAYSLGLKLYRIDKSKGYSKDNCKWVNDVEFQEGKESSVRLEYNGLVKTLRGWSEYANVPLNGLRQRYFKSKNYTTEEIIYGRKTGFKSTVKCFSDCNEKQIKRKASKMLSQYRMKDLKKGYNPCDISLDWFLKNISSKPCHYCGDTKKIGCDRVNNRKGHTMDNVVPACYTCNTARQDLFSVDEMLRIGEIIKDIKLKRSIT